MSRLASKIDSQLTRSATSLDENDSTPGSALALNTTRNWSCEGTYAAPEAGLSHARGAVAGSTAGLMGPLEAGAGAEAETSTVMIGDMHNASEIWEMRDEGEIKRNGYAVYRRYLVGYR